MTIEEIYNVMEENGFGLKDLIEFDFQVFVADNEGDDYGITFEEWCAAYAK